jgi:hypothetical protein
VVGEGGAVLEGVGGKARAERAGADAGELQQRQAEDVGVARGLSLADGLGPGGPG